MHPPEWEAGPPNGAPTATSSTPRPSGRPWRRRVSGRGASELVNKSRAPAQAIPSPSASPRAVRISRRAGWNRARAPQARVSAAESSKWKAVGAARRSSLGAQRLRLGAQGLCLAARALCLGAQELCLGARPACLAAQRQSLGALAMRPAALVLCLAAQRLCRQGSVPRGASQPFAECSDPSCRSLSYEPEYTLDAALPGLNSHWFQ
jgi:hypothetical protein